MDNKKSKMKALLKQIKKDSIVIIKRENENDFKCILKNTSIGYDFHNLKADNNYSKDCIWGIACDTIKEVRDEMLKEYINGEFTDIEIVD